VDRAQTVGAGAETDGGMPDQRAYFMAVLGLATSAVFASRSSPKPFLCGSSMLAISLTLLLGAYAAGVWTAWRRAGYGRSVTAAEA
jgi:hypothetical protein